jgi:hypothetical protein
MKVWLALALSCVTLVARAETRRVAVVIGNNVGAGEQPPLRYAEADAEKVARVLEELGGVAHGDLILLRGQSREQLEAALKTAGAKAAAWHAHGDRVVLLLYFSGHSDGESLELGGEHFRFVELRKYLASTGADVRLAIVDTCKSGALLAAKGGTPVAGDFQIRLSDELASKGEALLTSSAANEVALESREIAGSFFTHHLVSGLRGAADRSGDGRVTLAEAYEYTFAHTVAATAQTVIGPQHPVYDYRLAGEGELVLAELRHPSASMALPGGFDRSLVLDAERDRVIAEVPASAAATRIALSPGRYAVRAWRGQKVVAGAVTLHAGESRTVWAEELHPVSATLVRAKGDGGDYDLELENGPWHERPLSLSMLGGFGTSVAGDLGIMPAARLELDFGRVSGPSLALDLASGRGVGFRETSVLALIGWRWGIAHRRLSGFVGGQAGGGSILQDIDHSSLSTPVGVIAPWVGGSVRLWGPLALAAEAQYALRVLQSDNSTDVQLSPSAWLGVRVGL